MKYPQWIKNILIFSKLSVNCVSKHLRHSPVELILQATSFLQKIDFFPKFAQFIKTIFKSKFVGTIIEYLYKRCWTTRRTNLWKLNVLNLGSNCFWSINFNVFSRSLITIFTITTPYHHYYYNNSNHFGFRFFAPRYIYT